MTDYPSDAPLPQFNITRVQGKSESSNHLNAAVGICIECSISNYQSFVDWWLARGYEVRNNYLRLIGDIGYPHEDFQNGVSTGGYLDVVYPIDYEKWHTISFTQMFNLVPLTGGGEPMIFGNPLYLCDIYVPNADTLPVWTDLQFTVSSPIPEVSWIVPALFIGLVVGIGVYGFWRHRK